MNQQIAANFDPADITGTDLKAREQALMARLRALGSVVVAYSGGVDSAYLAWAAFQALGSQMLAVIADSASLARSQLRDAVEFAREHAVPLQVIKTHELEREQYAVNGPDRCFHCKDELFATLEQVLAETGFQALGYGLNLDDKQDFRPGHKAAAQHRVAAPLAEAGLSKSDVRALSLQAGLRVWDKPASACLSSRMEYGRRVTPEALLMIEQAEDSLRALGLKRFRVRHHGSIARIEIAEEEMATVLHMGRMKAMAAVVRAAGFQYVSLDCEGYRSGSMNEILPVEVLAGFAIPAARSGAGE